VPSLATSEANVLHKAANDNAQQVKPGSIAKLLQELEIGRQVNSSRQPQEAGKSDLNVGFVNRTS
jgi:hypothetical protein